MKSRRTTLIVAVVLAVATGVLTLRYLSSLNQQAQHVVSMRPIVIANVDIPARSKIKATMLTKVMKPEAEIEPGAITDPKQAEGDVSLVTIPAGAPVVQSKIGVPASVGITGRLRIGQRAVSIPVDLVKSVSGLIEPGDRVDVMASVGGASNAGKNPRTYAIIRGATILAVNSTIEPNAQASGAPNGPEPAPGTVTLAVSAAQANLLTVADLNANLRLALRSPEEAVRSLPAESIDLSQPAPAAVPQNAAAPAAPAAAAPAPAPAPAQRAPAAPEGIPVIDGDRVTMNQK